LTLVLLLFICFLTESHTWKLIEHNPSIFLTSHNKQSSTPVSMFMLVSSFNDCSLWFDAG
jgi:hypothetical protein